MKKEIVKSCSNSRKKPERNCLENQIEYLLPVLMELLMLQKLAGN
jgi:hypothetical protein